MWALCYITAWVDGLNHATIKILSRIIKQGIQSIESYRISSEKLNVHDNARLHQ
jgi:hypothetical protein